MSEIGLVRDLESRTLARSNELICRPYGPKRRSHQVPSRARSVGWTGLGSFIYPMINLFSSACMYALLLDSHIIYTLNYTGSKLGKISKFSRNLAWLLFLYFVRIWFYCNKMILFLLICIWSDELVSKNVHMISIIADISNVMSVLL